MKICGAQVQVVLILSKFRSCLPPLKEPIDKLMKSDIVYKIVVKTIQRLATWFAEYRKHLSWICCPTYEKMWKLKQIPRFRSFEMRNDGGTFHLWAKTSSEYTRWIQWSSVNDQNIILNLASDQVLNWCQWLIHQSLKKLLYQWLVKLINLDSCQNKIVDDDCKVWNMSK